MELYRLTDEGEYGPLKVLMKYLHTVVWYGDCCRLDLLCPGGPEIDSPRESHSVRGGPHTTPGSDIV